MPEEEEEEEEEVGALLKISYPADSEFRKRNANISEAFTTPHFVSGLQMVDAALHITFLLTPISQLIVPF